MSHISTDHKTNTKLTSRFPIDLYPSQLFVYHLMALLKSLSFWYDSSTTKNASLSLSLSQSSLAIFFLSVFIADKFSSCQFTRPPRKGAPQPSFFSKRISLRIGTCKRLHSNEGVHGMIKLPMPQLMSKNSRNFLIISILLVLICTIAQFECILKLHQWDMNLLMLNQLLPWLYHLSISPKHAQ